MLLFTTCTVDSPLTDTSIRQTPPKNGHLESVPVIQILQSFSYNLTLIKTDSSLKQTFGASPEGVRLRESCLYLLLQRPAYLSTVNTRAILPMARILLRITSFLFMASLCSSSSSPSSSSSVQILRIFTSISVTENNKVKVRNT